MKWLGKCPGCNLWDTFEEVESVDEDSGSSSGGGGNSSPAKVVDISKSIKKDYSKRITVDIGEVDRVLGGGLVEGEVVLLSGNPGIGKSTLVLQICSKLAASEKVLFVSGEESLNQLANRYDRVAGSSSPKSKGNFIVTEETDVDQVIAAMEKEKPAFVAVDSIQSIYTGELRGFPGSLSQVRECGVRLTRAAKNLKIPVFIVGQVTKEGVVAGPRVLEHVVDAVLYFEIDDSGLYRMLRGEKNRFGTVDEVGIFEMTSSGLEEVKDPSSLFSASDKKPQSGVVKSAVYKGSRVILVEIQSLTSGAMFAAPRRLPTGFSKPRLEMLCAVISRRLGVNLGNEDVFVNVGGGMKIDDPSIDLAVCAAIVSAKKDKPVPSNNVFVGEVSLSGDARAVAFQDRIVSEIKRRKLLAVGPDKKSAKRIKSLI